MSDTTASLPTQLAPGEFKPSPEAIEFVQQGVIRIHFPPPPAEPEKPERIVRVRRPFLGELKTLRLGLQDMQDDLSTVTTQVLAEASTLRAESEELARRRGEDEIDAEDHADALAEIRKRDRAGARRMDDAREEGTLGWWELVLKTLALDPYPDRGEFPSWILDARLPNLVLNHWRLVPSGPG